MPALAAEVGKPTQRIPKTREPGRVPYYYRTTYITVLTGSGFVIV
jgi:hypothetical protein